MEAVAPPWSLDALLALAQTDEVFLVSSRDEHRGKVSHTYHVTECVPARTEAVGCKQVVFEYASPSSESVLSTSSSEVIGYGRSASLKCSDAK